MKLLQEDFVLKPCIIYRRYLVGNLVYAGLNPAEAETHMCLCQAGCADFFHVTTMTVWTGEEAVPLSELRRQTVSTLRPCHATEVLHTYLPEPGTPEFHMLVCDNCRCDHLGVPLPAIRLMSAVPIQAAHRARVRVTDPRQHCHPAEKLKDLELDPGALPFHLLTCDPCRREHLRIMAGALKEKYLAPPGSLYKPAAEKLSRAG